ncbi:hypothetical protein AAG570_003337 [Ranatra chinensis]|uniref:Uncharacterized protein n=1 Tax=Ranatra chinensis TaxID=642074 RepID=A0ABD0Y4K2_9HEMI
MGGNGTGTGGMSSSSRLSSVGSSNGGMSPSSPLTANNNYANEEIFRLEEKWGSTNAALNDEEVQSPVYMNVMPGTEDPLPEEEEMGSKHCYANLTPAPPPPPLPPAPPIVRHVNYILLDLDQGGAPPPSPGPESPPPTSVLYNNNNSKLPKGYVTIDFDRTIALTYSTNPGHLETDPTECLRKTRHDSTINDLVMARKSALLSD